MQKQQSDTDLRVEFRFRVRREQVKDFLKVYSRYLDSNDLIDMGMNKFHLEHFVLLKTPLLPASEFQKIQDSLILLTNQYTVTTSMEFTNFTKLKEKLSK